jgi:hypothetical protein
MLRRLGVVASSHAGRERKMSPVSISVFSATWSEGHHNELTDSRGTYPPRSYQCPRAPSQLHVHIRFKYNPIGDLPRNVHIIVMGYLWMIGMWPKAVGRGGMTADILQVTWPAASLAKTGW